MKARPPGSRRKSAPIVPTRKSRFFRPTLELLETRALLNSRGGALSLDPGYGDRAMMFEANQGQTDPQVRFLSHGAGYGLFLTPTGAVLSLQKPVAPSVAGQPLTADSTAVASPRAVLTMQLSGANPAPQVVGLDQALAKSNYLRGNDPAQWHVNVPNFMRVEYQDVYPGINLIYHGSGQQLEYDFEITAGADPGVIAMNFGGAESMDLDAHGNLVLHTPGGDVVEHAPVIYQVSGGIRQSVSGHYVLEGASKVGFQVGAYDPGLPLVIDPVLAYSTYLGGFEGRGNAIAVDGKGNAFIAGSVASLNNFSDLAGTLDLPTKNALQSHLDSGTDAFVSELGPTGQLVFSTFLGGNADQSNVKPDPDPLLQGGLLDGQDINNVGSGIAVDVEGNVYLTGSTELGKVTLDNNVDTYVNYIGFNPIVKPFQNPDPNAFPRYLPFVAKLDATGSHLVYSSYLDVPHSDVYGKVVNSYGAGIALDAQENAYVVGSTEGITTAALLATAFVAKIKSTGGLEYTQTLGDPNLDTFGNAIAVNALGEAYVAGTTIDSTTFATNAGPDDTFGGFDAFVAHLDPNGALVPGSVHLGGTGYETANAIALDAQSNVYVTGSTNSYNFPTSTDAFQPVRPPGDPNHQFGPPGTYYAAFVAKYNADLSLRVYSTYLAGGTPAQNTSFDRLGNGGEAGLAIAVDARGSVYVGGRTTSIDFPRASQVQPGYGGGWSDGFVAELDRSGSNLLYSTYLGGDGGGGIGGYFDSIPGGYDSVNGIALDRAGNAYVVGTTSSRSFPTTEDAIQKSFPAPDDAGQLYPVHSSTFISRLAPELLVTALPIHAVLGQPYTLPIATFTAPDMTAPASDFSAEINWGDGTPPEIVTPVKTNQPVAPIQPAAGPAEMGAASPADFTITDSSAPYKVIGHHSYTKPGSYPVLVTVKDIEHHVRATSTYNVSRLNGSQSETTVAVDPMNPKHVFAAANDPENDLFASYSVNGGVNWRSSTTPDGRLTPAAGADPLPNFASDPRAAFDNFGNLYLVGLRKGQNFIDVLLSADDGKTFRLIGSFGALGDTGPAETDENPERTVVDQPSIAVGPGDQPGTGSVWITYADYSVKSVYAVGARVTEHDQKAFDFGSFNLSAGELGNFGDIAVGPMGEVVATWQNLGGDPSTPFGAIVVSSKPDGLKTPNTFFRPPVALLPVPALGRDGNTRTPIPAQDTRGISLDIRLAWDRSGKTHNGRLYMAYTDVLKPTSAPNDTDIFVRHSDDGGTKWSPPVRVNDVTSGSQFFSSIAVDQSTGDVGVSWYDTRNDSSNTQTQFFVAVSGDGGDKFSANVPVSVGPSNASYPGQSFLTRANQYGDYTGTAYAGGMLYSAWADNSAALGDNPDLERGPPPAPFATAFDVAVGPVAFADVTIGPPVVTATPIRVPEGGTFQGQVATFIEGDASLSPSDFKVTIDWGDGPVDTTGSITQGAAGTPFIVRSSHRYKEEGTYPIVVTVTDTVNDLEGSSITKTNVSQAPGNQSEANIAVDPTNPSNLFAVSNNEGQGLFAAVSTDGGANWQGHPLADGSDLPLANGDPKVVFDSYGNLFLTYLSHDLKSIVLASSSDDGETFTRIYTFTSPGGTTPLGTIDPEGALVDQPSVAAGANSVWITFANLAGEAVMAIGAPVMGRGEIGEFAAPQAVPNSVNGNFGNIAIGPSGQVLVSFVQQDLGVGAVDSVSLDADGLGPGGFASPIIAARPNYTDANLPAQARRGIEAGAFLAWDAHQTNKDGRVYLVYTDAPDVGSTDTNIFVRSSTDSGATWSDPVRVNDDTGNNSQFLPTICVDPKTGDVAVGWYDARNDPDNIKTQFFVAGSTDAGSSFSTNVQVSQGLSEASDPDLNVNQRGDYTGIAVFGGIIYPIWADNSSALDGIPDPPEFDVATAQVTLAGVDDLPLTAHALDISADVKDEGEAFTADLASFLDGNPHGELADYSATIDWGDMTDPDQGDVRAQGGRFVVRGKHAYEEEGPHTITITITDKGGASVVVTSTWRSRACRAAVCRTSAGCRRRPGAPTTWPTGPSGHRTAGCGSPRWIGGARPPCRRCVGRTPAARWSGPSLRGCRRTTPAAGRCRYRPPCS